jgi:aspartate/methionine/tyrosine aminotransferase
METAKRLDVLNEYVFARILREAKEVETTTGKKVLNLSVGSPDFAPAPQYIAAFQEFLKSPKAHMYPGYGAVPEFEAAIISWHKNRFETKLKPENIFPTNGGKDAIVHINMALLDAGDEVMVPDPGYPAFSGSALLMGALPVPYPLFEKELFKPNLERLAKLITPKTKLIWFNFPSNPTGAVASIKELSELVNFAKEHKIWLAFDNAYSEITFEGAVAPSILEIPGALDVAIEIHSFSKSFSFAGYRMGWVAGNAKLVAALAKVKSQMDSGMSWPLQQLGALALTEPDWKWLKGMRENYSQRQQVLAHYFKRLGVQVELPVGSLYIWARVPAGYIDGDRFAYELLHDRHILVAPGSAFGKNGSKFIRISICSDITDISIYF